MKRIGTVDFFAVVPAGFYVLLVLSIALGIGEASNTIGEPSLWNPVLKMVDKVGDRPVLLVFVLFASYIFGISLRVLPVKWAEVMIPPFRNEFPYPSALSKVVEELTTHQKTALVDTKLLPEVGSQVPPSVYNYWKDYLCMNSVDGFSYYETFEARTRFFTGMFWAGCMGILCGIAILFKETNCGLVEQLAVLFTSILMVVLFRGQFRRVREQESMVLFTLFIAERQ